MTEAYTPPTTPMPTPEAAPDTDVVALHSLSNVSEQIAQSMRERETHSQAGLWVEAGRTRFNVLDAETEHQAQRETVKTSRMPQYKREGNILKLERPTTQKQVADKIVRIVMVEKIDDHGTVTVERLTEGDFYKTLDEAGVTAAGWEVAAEDEAETETKHITLRNDGNDSARLMLQLDASNVTKLDGLTWENQGHTVSIVKDVATKNRTFDGWKQDRAYVIKTTDPTGKPVSEKVWPADQLEAYLNTRRKHPLGKMRIEVPVLTSRDQDVIPALEDINEENLGAKLEELFGESAVGSRRSAAIQEAVGVYGLDRVLKLGSELKTINDMALERLHIEDSDIGVKQVMGRMADEFYYAKHPDAARSDMPHLSFTNPFEESYEGMHSHRAIIGSGLGRAFIKKALVPELGGQPQKVIDDDGYVSIKQRAVRIFELDPELDLNTKAFINPAIREILDQIKDVKIPINSKEDATDTEKVLTEAHFVAIGKQLLHLMGK